MLVSFAGCCAAAKGRQAPGRVKAADHGAGWRSSKVNSGTRTDVAICGGGHAGLTLALALSRTLGPEFEIAVVDRGAPEEAGPDPRAVAIAATSRRLLQALGLWSALEAAAEPVRRIEITDTALDAGLRPVLLAWDNDIDEAGGSATAAHIVPLPALSAALEAAIAAERSIRMLRPARVVGFAARDFDARIALADGAELLARLAVAADGQRSFLREAAGIKSVGWPYAQVGIATTVEHDRDHGGVAVQHFLPGGPFAILPLPGRRSCVTWTESEAEGHRIMALDDATFLDEVDLRFGGRLGAIRLAGGRCSWPLSLHLARAYVAPRLALVGDAAHGVHPIAGQGLNLGFRDVAALTEVIADAARTGLDIGDEGVLERYERWRRFDSMLAAAGFDALNRLFSRESHLLRSAREVGLQVVDRLPAMKRALVGEAAGTAGELPILLQGELP
jgi:2-octaprenyl-6-methoxyphenol hydroxylase